MAAFHPINYHDPPPDNTPPRAPPATELPERTAGRFVDFAMDNASSHQPNSGNGMHPSGEEGAHDNAYREPAMSHLGTVSDHAIRDNSQPSTFFLPDRASTHNGQLPAGSYARYPYNHSDGAQVSGYHQAHPGSPPAHDQDFLNRLIALEQANSERSKADQARGAETLQLRSENEGLRKSIEQLQSRGPNIEEIFRKQQQRDDQRWAKQTKQNSESLRRYDEDQRTWVEAELAKIGHVLNQQTKHREEVDAQTNNRFYALERNLREASFSAAGHLTSVMAAQNTAALAMKRMDAQVSELWHSSRSNDYLACYQREMDGNLEGMRAQLESLENNRSPSANQEATQRRHEEKLRQMGTRVGALEVEGSLVGDQEAVQRKCEEKLRQMGTQLFELKSTACSKEDLQAVRVKVEDDIRWRYARLAELEDDRLSKDDLEAVRIKIEETEQRAGERLSELENTTCSTEDLALVQGHVDHELQQMSTQVSELGEASCSKADLHAVERRAGDALEQSRNVTADMELHEHRFDGLDKDIHRLGAMNNDIDRLERDQRRFKQDVREQQAELAEWLRGCKAGLSQLEDGETPLKDLEMKKANADQSAIEADGPHTLHDSPDTNNDDPVPEADQSVEPCHGTDNPEPRILRLKLRRSEEVRGKNEAHIERVRQEFEQRFDDLKAQVSEAQASSKQTVEDVGENIHVCQRQGLVDHSELKDILDARFSEELKTLQKERKTAKSQLFGRIDKLAKDLPQTAKKQAEIATESVRADLGGRIDEVAEDVKAKGEAVAGVQSAQTEMESRIGQLNETVYKNSARHVAHEAERTGFRTRLSAVEAQVQNENVKGDVDELKGQVGGLKELVSRAATQPALDSALEKVEQKLQEAKSQSLDAADREHIEDVWQGLEGQIREAKEQSASAKTQIETLQASVDDISKQSSDATFHERHDAASAGQVARLDSVIAQFELFKTETNDSRKATERDIQDTKARIEGLGATLDSLSMQLSDENFDRRIEAATAPRMASLDDAIDRRLASLELAAQNHRITMRPNLEEIKVSLQDLQKRYKETAAYVKSLPETLATMREEMTRKDCTERLNPLAERVAGFDDRLRQCADKSQSDERHNELLTLNQAVTAEANEQFKELKQRLTHVDELLPTFARKDKSDGRYHKHQARFVGLEAKVNAAHTELYTKGCVIDNHRKRLDGTDQSLQKRKEAEIKANRDFAALDEKHTGLEERVKPLRKSLENARGRLERVERIMQTADDTMLDRTQRDEDERKNHFQDFKSQLETLSSEMQDLRSSCRRTNPQSCSDSGIGSSESDVANSPTTALARVHPSTPSTEARGHSGKRGRDTVEQPANKRPRLDSLDAGQGSPAIAVVSAQNAGTSDETGHRELVDRKRRRKRKRSKKQKESSGQ